MKITKTLGLKIAIAAGILSSPIGIGKIRQYCNTENTDTFIKTVETGIIPKSKNCISYNFVQSLVENKDKIQNVLKISDTQYKKFCILAIGIAKEETDFGLDNSYTIKELMPSVAHKVKKVFSKNKLSEGITNLKIKDIKNKKELDALKRLNISNIFNPEQSAIATIVHLNTLYEDYYKKYLKNIAPKHEQLLSEEEYILARWKGLNINTFDENPKIRAFAVKNMENIISDRIKAKPKYYVWKILRSIEDSNK